MSMLMAHVASRMFGTPLMMDGGKALAILAGLGGRIVDGGFELPSIEPLMHIAFDPQRVGMGRLGNPLGRRLESSGKGDRILNKIDNVAVIPIEGTLVHKGGYLGAESGETSYEGIQAQVARAQSDPTVKGVVFEIDSFGGEAAGAFDTADMIAELSAEKPTLSIQTDFSASAGYLLGSAARQIVMPETGGAGSIGAIMMHTDLSQKLEKQGVKVTLISSGEHKTAGHPALPLDAATLADMQAHVDASRDLLAGKIAGYRGGRLTKEAALATEAKFYRGAAAVTAGLVDGIVRPSQAFAQFVRAVNGAGRPL